MENHFVKTTLCTPNRDLNLDLPIIGSLVYCESSSLDHAPIKWAKQNCLPSAVPLFFKRNRSFAASKPVPREDPVIMKLDSPDFKSLFTPELTKLATIFKEYGYEIRIAGGALANVPVVLNQTTEDGEIKVRMSVG
uniref:Uncharacterized protein n=1 Tax=Timema genevievae TaxID=629358 RepID=A0A7R9PKU4_TIMGE|nr:unnamed protein product [Timema genevievae]